MQLLRLALVATLVAIANPARADDVRSRVTVQTPRAIYRLDRRIGGGYSGKTYRGHDEATGHPVAIKIHSSGWFRRGHADTLEKEARILALVKDQPSFGRSLGIARVGVDGKVARSALVMEVAKGRDLWWGVTRGGFAPQKAVGIARNILTAVGKLHARGYRHNDLHPGNVLYDDKTGEITVLDLGNATTIHEAFRVANDQYGPPEQRRGSTVPMAGSVTSDTYHVGGILAHMLTGEHPNPKKPLEILDRIPDVRATAADGRVVRLVDVVRKAREPNPAKRYQSAAEMLDALRPFLR